MSYMDTDADKYARNVRPSFVVYDIRAGYLVQPVPPPMHDGMMLPRPYFAKDATEIGTHIASYIAEQTLRGD